MSSIRSELYEGRFSAIALGAMTLAIISLALFTLLGPARINAQSVVRVEKTAPAQRAEAQVASMLDDRMVVHLKKMRALTSVLAQATR